MLPPALVFEQIVSKPRLDSYRGYWRVGIDAAIGLYMWNGELCGEFSKLLAYLEIALRNSIHREMSLNVSGGATMSTHWWDVVSSQLKPEARKQIQKVRDKAPHIPLSPDELVSRLTFGFWPNMLAWIAKQRPTLPSKILPGHPLSQAGARPNWFSLVARQQAVRQFLEFSDLRNRIAHHEPVWKFSDVLDTSPLPPLPARLVYAASTDEASTFARFNRLLRLYDQATESLSPALYASIRSSSWRMKLDFLLSPRGVQRYKDCCHIAEQNAIDTQELQERFAAVVERNRPVRVLDDGGEGLFIPI